MTNETAFTIKAYPYKTLRVMYGVSWRTFNKWIKKIPDLGEYDGKAYTPAQVEKIVNHIGRP
jgi:hypothetical protein